MPGRRFTSFDWYESTTGDYIQPVKVEERAAAKVEEKAEEVTVYITGQTANKQSRRFWAITLYDGFTKEFRTYEVRKSVHNAPCTLRSSKGHPGEAGVGYITLGKVSYDRAQELVDLCETVRVPQSKSAAYANRQYINDLARFLVAGDFITKGQRGRAMSCFSRFINDEHKQVEAENQKAEVERKKAEAEREKAKAQWQKAKNDRQSQIKAKKNTGTFPAWFLDGGNN